MDRLSFEGRVAIVTGGGRGVGRAHAILLASRGAKVLVNDLGAKIDMTGSDPGPANSVVAEIEAAGGEAAANSDSVASREGAEAIVAAAADRWGRVDVLINNAGGASRGGAIDELPELHLRRMIDTHLLGTFHMIGAAWPLMVDQKYGRILNTSSGTAFGISGEYAYSAVKAGVIGLTKSLAIDAAEHGITVNCLLPVAGTRLSDTVPKVEVREWVRTNFPAEQVAAVAVALVHESMPVTGEAFHAGGGQAARVFFGVSAGITDAEISPEMVIERVDEVMSTENWFVGGGSSEFMGANARPSD